MPDPTTLFLALIFGTIGMVALKRAKSDGNIPCVPLGIALLAFPYFVEGWVLTLAIGGALTFGVWKFWDWD